MLDQLNRYIDSHDACENAFFVSARSRGWTRGQVLAFAPEYYYWIRSFPQILSLLVANSRDDDTRFLLTEILFSELGSGNPDNMHFKLFERTLLALDIGGADVLSGPQFTETNELVAGMSTLYSSDSILRALGAQYALEKQAFPMIDNLDKGFRRFPELTEAHLTYFSLHLTEEPEHLRCMVECIDKQMVSEHDVATVYDGARQCLNLIAAFWNRLDIETRILVSEQPQ